MSTVVERVHELVAPVLTDLGLDLYDLEWAGGVLRVVVDRPGGADLDLVATATRLISRELDHADPLPGHYQLEVSTPGLERKLRTAAHFQGAVGTTVKLRTHAHVPGERRLEGVVVAADADAVTVAVAGGEGVTEQRVPYVDIERARTVFVWEPAPKPGKGTPRPSSQAGSPPAGTQRKAAAS